MFRNFFNPINNNCRHELDRKVEQMILERARQDEEARQRHFPNQQVLLPQPLAENPMSREELNQKVNNMMWERARQDAQAREKYMSSGVHVKLADNTYAIIPACHSHNELSGASQSSNDDLPKVLGRS